MATLAQRPIAGFSETSEKSVINGNLRMTYGFANNTISVKVEVKNQADCKIPSPKFLK